MAHDVHFLSRLDRLDDRLVEYAMSLYRNVPLVKEIVKQTAPPEATRVAIALSDKLSPPHVIVSADGAFVTCLAAGMKHDLPVISRAAVERAAERQEHLRRLLAVSRQLKGDRSFVAQAMRVYGGPRLSREEMNQLLEWEPVLGVSFLSRYFDAAEAQEKARHRLQRKAAVKSKHERELERCWNESWATGHLAVASHRALRRYILDFGADTPPFARLSVPSMALYTHHPSTMLRGVWVAAALGDLMIDDAERAYLGNPGVPEGWMSMLALVAIGLRWKKLRGRAAAALAQSPASTPVPDADALAQQDLWRSVLNDPAPALERHLSLTTTRLKARGADLTGFDARTILTASLYTTYPLQTRMAHNELIDAMAFVAASEAEDLYLPQAQLASLPEENPVEAARAFGDFLRAPDETPAPPPPPSPPKTGRNEPCPCGSGLKFKKCHGA